MSPTLPRHSQLTAQPNSGPCRLYLLALKKREKRRELLDKANMEQPHKTREDKEDEILNMLLPMGVDVMNKRGFGR